MNTHTENSTDLPVPPVLPVLRDQVWAAVADGDEYTATGHILTAIDQGLDVESALLDVIAPVQARVGAEWAANRFSVANEHAASAIAERVIAALAHRPARRTAPRLGRITVACVDQEWHALPARLLAEVLTLRGWRVDFLGAQVPTPHLVAHLHSSGADAVALSSSLATRLPVAHAAVTACQAVGVPVLVGGAAFGPDGRYARLLGADAWAPDARAAARLLQDGVPVPDRARAHVRTDDLPHLSDQEYTHVARDRARLVREVLPRLEKRFPAMAAYTEEQRERTAEDVAHLLDHLAVALYVDDDELFSTFVTWTAGILTARHVPAVSLDPTLDILTAELSDFPRSRRLLTNARRALGAFLAPAGTTTGEPV
ncbi:cobalamin B12-binding domain-containing protein [Streptomyces nitrosporeus]|uniref:Cobalamin B12-binding domain-containing protein n=1 Tax=Streptomyces nitrosporeus TaxID=28894 RepID=A0A5J6F9S2_9ACTN|nr:cobalamin B12-binding domain-containing protein [Streptomyces nitrosporeus]QEU71765.1 cobalamin B12-binding domain-containing protein [Streptomyces nitrosporeus]GGY94481.1 cobalamin-binding protein [Streptomyces nitrosporeus]